VSGIGGIVKNLGGIVKSLQNIMWKDPGVSGDGQRIEQLAWMLFLKVLDDKDIELELEHGAYDSVIPPKLRWRSWAADPEGITGDELAAFVDKKLFPGLRRLDVSTGNRRALIVRRVFEGTNNYMKNGTIIRQVLNELQKIDFNASEDRHLFGDIYESILRDLQSAGNYGEFYTPRALTEFMTDMVAPKPGERILDPACGTGGFLASAIEHLRGQLKKLDELRALEKDLRGMELKPLPYMLAVTNLILHDMETPSVEYCDSLNREYSSIKAKDKVDIILANPPFGASVADGVETNYPLSYRTTESADLFLLLMIRYLKDGGRAAIVLPDGSLTGDGVKSRIREHFLKECELHTVVRLPNSVFQPYASVATNLLFFTKGKPTKNVWYWEHRLPEGQKAYSKTKTIRKEEFAVLAKWWKKRSEGEQAWKVSIADIEARGWSLDLKNPNAQVEEKRHSSAELLGMLHESFKKSDELVTLLKKGLRQ
jgi:type I restriction enzyme M protein